MPSHTIHSALVKMYFDGDGAPWTFPQWRRLTHVSFGLFAAADDQLPEGWTRENANFIRSYFDQYNKHTKEDARITFSAARKNGPQVPGRNHWRNWVTKVIKDSGVHRIITQVLMENSLHPLTICLNSRSGSLDFWPDGRMYVPLAVDNVALELFGSDALDPLGRLQLELRDSTQAIIQRTWKNIGDQLKRSRKRITKLEAEATEAFLSESRFLPLSTYSYIYQSFSVLKTEKLTKTILKRVIVRVARWKALAEILCTKDNLEKIDQMDEELKELMHGLGAEVIVKITKTRKCM
jgi:hypothetical protein